MANQRPCVLMSVSAERRQDWDDLDEGMECVLVS